VTKKAAGLSQPPSFLEVYMYKPHYLEVTYSPHDGGWYGVVIQRSTGSEVFESRLRSSQHLAVREARVWYEKQKFENAGEQAELEVEVVL